MNFSVGALLIFYSLIVALYTRYLKIKIMEKKGVRNIDQYHKYLHVIPYNSSMISINFTIAYGIRER